MDLLLFGMQGSGKGTQAQILTERYGLKVFEMGGELRAMVQSGSELGNRIKGIIEVGNLVDDATIMEIVEAFLAGLPADQPVLFDGIPRTMAQADQLLELLKRHGREVKALYLEISKQKAVERMLSRGRQDDTQEIIEKRIGLFLEQTVPVIERFRQQGQLIEIDGEQSVEQVTEEIVAKVGEVVG